jgi:hypothetical protein
MVQDIIWKADCHSACQKISCFLMEPEGSVLCSHKPATGPYPEPDESSLPHWSYLPKVHLTVILPPTSRSSQWSLPFGPPYQNPVNTSPFPQVFHMSCPPQPPCLITLPTFDEEYMLWSSSLCYFLHDPSSFLLGQNILNTLFSKTLSLCSSPKAKDQVSQPYT